MNDGEKRTVNPSQDLSLQCELVLGGSVLVADAARIRGQMVAVLERPGDVRVDAGGVACIDTAGLQLAVALAAVCEREGRALTWAAVSDTARAAAADLGVCGALGWA